MDTERMERAAEAVRKAEMTVNVIADKVMGFLSAFADNLEAEVERYNEERTEAMKRHPAGGVSSRTLTRSEKIDYIRKNGSLIYRSAYTDDFVDDILDWVVNRDYLFVKAAVERAEESNPRLRTGRENNY